MTIGAIAMLGMVKMTGDQAKAQRNLAVKGNFDSTMLQLRQYLSYQDNCSDNLLPAGYPVPTNSTGAPLNISSIAQIPFAGNPIIAGGTNQPDFVSVNVSLETFSHPPGAAADSYTANIVVKAWRKRGTNMQDQFFLSKLPIYVQLGPVVNGKRAFVSCAMANTNCPNGMFFQSASVGCVPPVELLTADPVSPFQGEMWLRTDIQ